MAFTAGIVLSVGAVIYRSRARITAESVVFLATLSVLVAPYFLSMMHERYSFPADVIAIVLAFYGRGVAGARTRGFLLQGHRTGAGPTHTNLEETRHEGSTIRRTELVAAHD